MENADNNAVFEKTQPHDYGPRTKPTILSLAEAMRARPAETLVQQVDELCSIVDRGGVRAVGIGVPVCFESNGYPNSNEFNGDTMNDYFIAKKYIGDGTVAFLAQTLGVTLSETDIISARIGIHGDGNYTAVVGIVVDEDVTLPMFMPEHAMAIDIPAGRFAKVLINEQKIEGRLGYPERMHADEYFIGAFRENTPYVYDKDGVGFYTFDVGGDVLVKYEPIVVAENDAQRYASIETHPVALPPMKIACAVDGMGEDNVIYTFFNTMQAQVAAHGLGRFYSRDYYGFPIDTADGLKGCFGMRVTAFDGLPETISRQELPGGLYVHITQLENNGDNPSIPYAVAFGHFQALWLDDHPEYEFDHSRHVIARFRHANCASVFAPVRLKADA